MANLPTIGQRLNDVEINNNKPVSSQVLRRVGSSINYLLDFLSITDGSTSPGSGSTFNQFSAPQVISYSYFTPFGSSDLNTPITLFTFQGAGDRPLFFYNDNGSGYTNAGSFTVSNSTNVAMTALTYPPGIGAYNPLYPIYNIARRLLVDDIVSTSGSSTAFEIRVDGVLFAKIYRTTSGTPIKLDYYSDILFAPTGTHTVTLTKKAVTTINVTVADSFRCVAL